MTQSDAPRLPRPRLVAHHNRSRRRLGRVYGQTMGSTGRPRAQRKVETWRGRRWVLHLQHGYARGKTAMATVIDAARSARSRAGRLGEAEVDKACPGAPATASARRPRPSLG